MKNRQLLISIGIGTSTPLGFVQQFATDAADRIANATIPAFSRATIRSMTRGTRDLLAEALRLPLDERAKFAAELLESLEGAENDVEQAWASEIQKRVSAARAGELASTDWRTVLERVEKEVLGR